jgi:hypothetical protein
MVRSDGILKRIKDKKCALFDWNGMLDLVRHGEGWWLIIFVVEGIC